MKRKALVLLVGLVIPAITNACCCCCDGGSVAERIPTYVRAEVIKPKVVQYWCTNPVGGLKIDNSGYDLGFFANPSLGAGTGLSDKWDISVQTDFKPNFWALGKYGLVTGPNAMSIGAKVSANGFPLPGDNTLDTANRSSRGHLDLSALYLLDSKPGSLGWTLSLGPSFNYDKNRLGQGSSLHFGAEFQVFAKNLAGTGIDFVPFVAADAKALSFDPTTNSFSEAPFQGSVGFTLSGEIAGVGSR